MLNDSLLWSKKKKKTFFLIGGIIILTLLVGGAFIIGKNSSRSGSLKPNNYPVNKPIKNDQKPIPPKKDNPDPEQPNPLKPIPLNNNSEKKVLANLVKNDLTTILANKNASYKDLYSYRQFPDGSIYYAGSDNEAVKKELEKYNREVSPDDLEPEDWKEIVNLVRQLEKTYEEKGEQEEQQREEKLTNNPDLFYYRTSGSIERNGGTFRFKNFLGKKSGANFHLYISENHPTLTNIGSHLEKTENERFYLITGFAEPTQFNSKYKYFEKFIDSDDKITVTSANS